MHHAGRQARFSSTYKKYHFGGELMNFATTREAASELGISLRRLMTLLAEGKLPGSYKLGLVWQIPQSALDVRVKELERFYAGRRRAPSTKRVAETSTA